MTTFLLVIITLLLIFATVFVSVFDWFFGGADRFLASLAFKTGPGVPYLPSGRSASPYVFGVLAFLSLCATIWNIVR